ncbi:MAG: hypothetical protein ACJ72E_10895 [Marmoricola sp.]
MTQRIVRLLQRTVDVLAVVVGLYAFSISSLVFRIWASERRRA